MSRTFASNMALCATLSQALASRLLMQQTLDELHGVAFASDDVDTPINIVPDTNLFEPGRDIFNVIPTNLAQTTQQTDNPHTCTHVMDIHKSTDAANFYDIVNNQGTYYLDEEFPTNDAHYYFDGGSNETGSGMVSHASKDSWHRINEGNLFKQKNVSLFGSKGIRPQDIRQGEIGNCWYLSSITALAEYPGRIEGSFLNKEISAAGVYGIQMYALGVPITVMVDDHLPLYGSSGSRTRYSQIGTDGSVWGPLMEKAFAKFHGNYARIVAGDPVQGVSTMNGSPYERYWTQDLSEAQIWETLSMYDHDLQRGLMQAGTHNGGGRSTYGLVKNHAYVIIGVDTLNDGTKLIKMRNPWGVEGFKGQYKDANMSADVKAQLDHDTGNDGNFWMTVPEFKSDVQYVGINLNTENWKHGHFLVLDDDQETGASPGKWNFCGQSCSRYTAIVKNTSGQKQMIHVSANTWRSRSYAETDECMDATWNVNKAHSIYMENDNRVYTFWNDARWMDAVEFDVGQERIYTVELDLSRKGMSKDWSVAAWGESGNVEVTVVGKGESAAFPHVEQDHSRLPEDEGKENGGGGGNDNDAAKASAEKAEDAAEEAARHVTNMGYIMQTVLMKADAVMEHVQNTGAHLLTAQLQMEKAKKALEDAIICCGLTFVENGEGEETTLEQLAGYLKQAKAAAAAAEEAFKKAKEEHKKAQEEKALMDDSVKDVKDLADKTEAAMKTASEELEKIKKLTVTPEQQAALARAQKAYDEAVASKKAADQQVAEAEGYEKEADAALKEARSNEDAALKHVQASDDYIKRIQALIDEREGGDDLAEECADDVEEILGDVKALKEKASMKKSKVDETKKAIADYAAQARVQEKAAREEEARAETVLDGAQDEGRTCETLAAAEKEAKGHKTAADLAQNSASFAHATASFELDNKLTPALDEMAEYVDKIYKQKELAKADLEDCKKYQDTAEQIEDLERATEAYDEICQIYEDCLAAEKEAIEGKATAAENVGNAKTSSNNAEISKKRIDAIVADIKIIIGSEDCGDDGDCAIGDMEKKAHEHFADSKELLTKTGYLQKNFESKGMQADEHEKALIDIEVKAKQVFEAANADKNDMAKLEAHLMYAKDHVDGANSALESLEATSLAATQVKETALKQVLAEHSELGNMNKEHMAALKEIMGALMQAEELFSEAKIMHDDISGIADKAEGDVKEIADQAEMGQKTRDSVKEYVAKIEKLIKNLEDGVVDEDEDDQIAENAAKDCEEAEKEGKQAMESAKADYNMVDLKKADIEKILSHDLIFAAFRDFENAHGLLEKATNDFDDDLEQLEEFKMAIEKLGESHAQAVKTAEDKYDEAVAAKLVMTQAMGSLPMYAQAAEDAKYKAKTAYDIAIQHDDTPEQIAAEIRARDAYIAAKEHCAKAKELLHEAEDMSFKSATILEQAIAMLTEAQKLDFEPIYEDIDELIEGAQNGGGGDGDDAQLEDWLETIEADFSKKCHRRSAKTESTTFADGTGAIAAAHICGNQKKMMRVDIKGNKAAKDWLENVTDIVGSSTEPDCKTRSGKMRCLYYVKPEDGQKFAIGFDGIEMTNLSVSAKILNLQ